LSSITMTNKSRLTVGQLVIYALLIIGSLFYLYPLFWLLINSLKQTPEIFSNPWALPERWIWENYPDAWTTGNVSRYVVNSIILTGTSLVVVLLLSSMAAFALTQLKWKLSKLTLLYFLIGFMVPVHATLIPLFVYFTRFNLVDSQLGLGLIYSSFGLPLAVLVLCGFLSAIPRELLEAAVIDGSSVYGLYWRIVLPVSKPALMTVTILSFVAVWNELLLALIFLTDQSKFTLPVGLTRFSDLYVTDYAPMFAAIVIATIPTLILFAIFNKRVLAGMAEGAIKG